MTSVLQLSKQLIESPQVVDIEQFTVRTFAPADVQTWLELRHRSFAREKLGVRQWTAADFEAEFRQRWWWDPAKMWLAESKSTKSRLLGSVTLAMRGEPPNVAASLQDAGQCSITDPDALRFIHQTELRVSEKLAYVGESLRDSQLPRVKPVVHWLMVAPEARRQGLARVLMSRLEAAAWNAGHREIYLETHSAWRAAAQFYEALGYHLTNPSR